MPLPTRRLLLVLGAAALAMPGAALATGGTPESGSQSTARDKAPQSVQGKSRAGSRAKKVKLVTYVVKGTYSADGTVDVTRGNAHARRAGLIGDDVAFDFSAARVVVADTDGDGKATVADLAAGDRVLVQARLPRRAPGTGPHKARKVVDQTNPPVEEAEVAPAPGA
ncbi:MAG: hypothetical protein AVDCRST_MAG69-2458 [uncultured Solirubrobacteraceae bacterium]|uniref:DUF5666 domain-containing protein n=1 Tax=uncultured Solirubrobacteraceae bacterium TaxID=1162706 RepID=A0A6J4T0S1_9ACTN|nr:MAG: hypothetical protein AVDCRST_MAG69-2458 [uncultured Solirubrobacteraceae bacterium]